MRELVCRLKILFTGVPKCTTCNKPCKRCDRLMEKCEYYKDMYFKLKSKLEESK